MLVNLHVKNLALIEEENIDFDEGLNILSGETGAGKSIILGSINAALGSKTSPDFIRSGCEYGLSEITFAIPEDKIERIKELGPLIHHLTQLQMEGSHPYAHILNYH